MADATVAQTLGATVLAVVERSGHYRNQGTYTAGTTTSGTDATNERRPVAEANLVTSTFIYKRAGAGAGEASEITSYATIGVHTWNTANTAPDTTTTWVRMAVRPQVVLDIIAALTREAAKLQAKPYESTALVTNNLLMHYGAMEEWANGAALAPDGWTLAGAGSSIAREATVIAQGLYSVAVTAGAGAVATLTRTLPTYLHKLIQGQSLSLLGMIAENVAADITVRVAVTDTAGTATNTDRAGTLTGNRWQELEDISTAGIAIPDPVGSVAVSTRSALSAVTYADDLVLYGPTIHDYDLPATMIGLETSIGMESAYRRGDFNHRTLRFGDDWILISRDGTLARTIHFFEALPSARHLQIKGFRAPDVVTSATTNVEPNPEWLTLAAAVRLLETHPEGGNKEMLPTLQGRLAKLERSPVGNTMTGKSFVWIEPV